MRLGLLVAMLLVSIPGHATRLTALLGEELSTLTRLEQLTEQSLRLGHDLEDLQASVDQLRRQEGELQRKIKALERRTSLRRALLQRRVRALYKGTRGGLLRLVFGKNTRGGNHGVSEAASMHRRVTATRRLLKRDLAEIALFGREKRALTQKDRELRQRAGVRRAKLSQLRHKQRDLKLAQQQQQQLLAQLRRSRRARQELARTLSAHQRRLVRRIAQLTHRLAAGSGFTALKGKLPMPVRGYIVGVFGHQLLRTGRSRLKVLRHGITLRTDPGARVKAVTAGKVLLADRVQGFGRVVLLEHEEGYLTLYGFLARMAVEPGQRVEKGTRLGRSGIDPLSGKPATYFELRRGERALDPAEWLKP